VCTTLGRLGHFAALVSEQLGQQSALRQGQSRCRNVVSLVFHTHLLLRLAVLNPLDPTARPSLMSWLYSSQCQCHRVSQRQSCSDDDYSEGDELDQIFWPFSVGVSVTEEARSANAQRVGSFHIYNTPFTNKMTIFMQ
jgi:hypothetical protein